MRFLLDENQSPKLVEYLGAAGYDVVHVRDVGLSAVLDSKIMEAARADQRIIVSGDTDFGELLARTNAAGPSLILLRRQDNRRAVEIAALIEVNLAAVSDDLEAGAIVVFDQDRIRVRRLPFRPVS